MEDLDFNAVLADLMTPTLDAIVAGLEQIAEAAGQAAEAMSAAFGEAAVDADALAGSTDAAAASTDALAGSMDTAAASTDANTVSTKANADAADAAAASHAKMNAAAKAMIMPLGIATAVVVGVGVAAVHMAGDFQSGLTTLVTGAGELQSNLGLMHDGILRISADTGESTSQLINGMFLIESSGVHGAAALAELQDAAEGAKVGGADLGATANALTTVLATYGSKGISAAQATNDLINIVSHGKSHMQDLATSISTVLPAASKYGVSLSDVSAALATMTAQNGDASTSTTYLKQLLTGLASPSTASQKALKSIGLTAQEVSDGMKRSLPDTLQLITDHINSTFKPGSVEANEAFKAIAGGSKNMQGMLLLTGTSMATFKTNAKDMSASAKQGGSAIQGWALVQKDFNQQMSQVGAKLGVAMIQLGEAITPVATALLQHLQPALAWLMDHGKLVAIVLGILAVAFGGALVAALTMVTIAFIAANIAALPWIALGAAIALVIVGLVIAVIYLKTHWAQIAAWLSGEWHTIMTAVGGWFSNLGTQAHGMWTTITNAFGAGIAAIGGLFSGFGSSIHSFITNWWNGNVALFHAGVAAVKNLVLGFVNDLVAGFLWLFNHNYYFRDLVLSILAQFHLAQQIVTEVWNAITGFLTGAWNKLVGLAKLAWAFVVADVQYHWGLVKTYIIAPITFVVGWLVGQGQAIINNLRRSWQIVSRDVSSAWNGFVGIITGVGGRIGGAVQDNVVSPITRIIATLITDAEQWGGKLVQMFISGLKAQAGALGSAASSLAGNVARFLGFHSPAEEGPGAQADQWMPNLGKMLAAGLVSQAPTLGAAANRVAGSLAGVLGSPSGTLGAGFPASALATGAGGGGYGGGPTQITVVLKDETGMGGLVAGMRMLQPGVMQQLATEIAKQMQAQGLLQGRQPIGYTGGR